MKKYKDNLEDCMKCGGDACYTTELNANAKNYFCFGCGFTTNDLMVHGEFDFEKYEPKYKLSSVAEGIIE